VSIFGCFFFHQRPQAVFEIFRRTAIKRIVLQSRTQGNLFLKAIVALRALFKVLFNLGAVSFAQLAIKVGMNHFQCFLTIQS
jgi:hypothetical protein